MLTKFQYTFKRIINSYIPKTMPSLNKYEKKPKTNVFHIRIGNNIDVNFFLLKKIDLKDPAFLKIL